MSPIVQFTLRTLEPAFTGSVSQLLKWFIALTERHLLFLLYLGFHSGYSFLWHSSKLMTKLWRTVRPENTESTPFDLLLTRRRKMLTLCLLCVSVVVACCCLCVPVSFVHEQRTGLNRKRFPDWPLTPFLSLSQLTLTQSGKKGTLHQSGVF